MPLPTLGGLPRQQSTCLGPLPTAETAAASIFRRWVGKVGGLLYSSPLLPPHRHPWCLQDEGNRLHQGKRSLSEPPQTLCVVTHWRNTGLCMQLGHAGDQGAARAGIDQEEPSQESPTSGDPKWHPCTRNGWKRAQRTASHSSPFPGSVCSGVMLEHSLPQQTEHKEGAASMGQRARPSAQGNRGAGGCSSLHLPGMPSETRL